MGDCTCGRSQTILSPKAPNTETCLDSLVSVTAFTKILMKRKDKIANHTGETNSPVWNTSLPQKRSANDSFLHGLPRRTQVFFWLKWVNILPRLKPKLTLYIWVFSASIKRLRRVWNWGPVNTYPHNFESATFSLRIQKFPRPHVSSTYPDSLYYWQQSMRRKDG